MAEKDTTDDNAVESEAEAERHDIQTDFRILDGTDSIHTEQEDDIEKNNKRKKKKKRSKEKNLVSDNREVVKHITELNVRSNMVDENIGDTNVMGREDVIDNTSDPTAKIASETENKKEGKREHGTARNVIDKRLMGIIDSDSVSVNSTPAKG